MKGRLQTHNANLSRSHFIFNTLVLVLILSFTYWNELTNFFIIFYAKPHMKLSVFWISYRWALHYIFTWNIIGVPLSIRLTSDRINKKRVMILISCIFQRKSHIAIDVNKAICWRTVNNEKCFICQQHVSAENLIFTYSIWYN